MAGELPVNVVEGRNGKTFANINPCNAHYGIYLDRLHLLYIEFAWNGDVAAYTFKIGTD